MGRGAITARVGKVWYTQDGVRRATCLLRKPSASVSVALGDLDIETGDTVLIEPDGSGWRLTTIGEGTPA